MQEDENIRERNTRTVSPPAFFKERNASVEFSSTKKNFHERNLDHLKTITDKNYLKIKQIEEEKKKLEITRQRLAQRVLKRNAESKLKEIFSKENEKSIKNIEGKNNVETIKEENEYREDLKSSATLKIDHKTRNLNYIQNLQESNKCKQQKKEEEEEKKIKNMRNLRENLGFHNVNSKLGEFEERKNNKVKIEEKKEIIRVKEEEKPIAKIIKKEEIPVEKDEKKFVKKSDEQSFQRLTQQPKRFAGTPIITDMSVFKKKNNLTEKDKVFIINGCYPDIKKALLRRSNIYIGRLI